MPAIAAGVKIDQGIRVMQDMLRDCRGNHLCRVAARIARIDLMEIGPAMLLGRLPTEARGCHGIRDRYHGKAAFQLRSVKSREELPNRDGRGELIAMGVGDYSEGGPGMASGHDMQGDRKRCATEHRVHLQPPE